MALGSFLCRGGGLSITGSSWAASNSSPVSARPRDELGVVRVLLGASRDTARAGEALGVACAPGEGRVMLFGEGRALLLGEGRGSPGDTRSSVSRIGSLARRESLLMEVKPEAMVSSGESLEGRGAAERRVEWTLGCIESGMGSEAA